MTAVKVIVKPYPSGMVAIEYQNADGDNMYTTTPMSWAAAEAEVLGFHLGSQNKLALTDENTRNGLEKYLELLS